MSKWEKQLQFYESLAKEIATKQEKGKGEPRFDSHVVLAIDRNIKTLFSPADQTLSFSNVDFH